MIPHRDESPTALPRGHFAGEGADDRESGHAAPPLTLEAGGTRLAATIF